MRIRYLAPIIFGSAALTGCGESTGPLGQHQLQVQVRASLASPSATATGPALAPGIPSVEIDEAVLVLGGLKLETAGLDQTVDWIFEESVVIPLDLAGQPTLAFDTDIPPGIYKELEVSIDKLEVGHPEEQALIDLRPSLADASVLVTGEVLRDGTLQTFEFAAALDIDMELPFATPLSVTEDDVLVTLVSLNIDLGQWFETLDGGTLDPNDPADRSEIGAAITRSIEVVKES